MNCQRPNNVKDMRVLRIAAEIIALDWHKYSKHDDIKCSESDIMYTMLDVEALDRFTIIAYLKYLKWPIDTKAYEDMTDHRPALGKAIAIATVQWVKDIKPTPPDMEELENQTILFRMGDEFLKGRVESYDPTMHTFKIALNEDTPTMEILVTGSTMPAENLHRDVFYDDIAWKYSNVSQEDCS